MTDPSETLKTTAAFLLGLSGLGLATFIIDPTPLLVEPRPDLDWPLGLVGVAAGLWSAYRVTHLAYVKKRKFGRFAIWLMFPLWLGLGLPAAGSRFQEAISFRRGAVRENVAVHVSGKERVNGRRGGVSYDVKVLNPFRSGEVTLTVDGVTFETIESEPGCAVVAIERATNGAIRLVAAERWNLACP